MAIIITMQVFFIFKCESDCTLDSNCDQKKYDNNGTHKSLSVSCGQATDHG